MIDKDDYFQAEYIDREWFTSQLTSEWTTPYEPTKEDIAEAMWWHYKKISPDLSIKEGHKYLLFYQRKWKGEIHFECDVVTCTDGTCMEFIMARSGEPVCTEHSECGKSWFIRKLV